MFFARMALDRVTVPWSFSMPPPVAFAPLWLMVLLVMVSVLPWLKMPPPKVSWTLPMVPGWYLSSLAELPLMVLLVTVAMAPLSLLRPPPDE